MIDSKMLQLKGMAYHLDCIFKIMEENGYDTSEYSKERAILKVALDLAEMAEKLEKLINDPTAKVE